MDKRGRYRKGGKGVDGEVKVWIGGGGVDGEGKVWIRGGGVERELRCG